MTAVAAAPIMPGAPAHAGSMMPIGPIPIAIPPAAISFATAELPARGRPGPLFLPPVAGGLGIMSGGIVVVVAAASEWGGPPPKGLPGKCPLAPGDMADGGGRERGGVMLPIPGTIPGGGGGVASSLEAGGSPLAVPTFPARTCRLPGPRLSDRDDRCGPRRAHGGGCTPPPGNG